MNSRYGRHRFSRQLHVPFLRSGNYTITVETPGFKKAIREGLTLQLGQTATINIPLEVGAVTDQITVKAESREEDAACIADGLIPL